MTRQAAFTLNTLIVFGATLALAACGGGGGDQVNTPPVQPSPMSTVYSGPISGFGSVIVNGMRFGTVGASLSDDDGSPVRLQDLALGMSVNIDGTVDDNTGRGRAKSLSLVHGNTGAITSIDRSSQTITVMGLTIKTNTATAYKNVASFSALAVGDAVEVYGTLQSDNTVLATLIEKETGTYTNRAVGRVSNLDTNAKTFKIGSLVVNYGTATVIGALAEGRQIKVTATQGSVNNVLIANSIKVTDGAAYGSSVASGTFLKIKGVAEAVPINGLLTVSGTRVNVAQATYEGGTTIAAGALLEIKGTWDGTVLQASKVELERNDRDNDGYIDRNELYGSVSSITTSNGKTLVVINGVTVDVTQAFFEYGSLAQLAVGVPVEVKGSVQGSVFIASKVEFKSGSNSSSGDFEYEQFGQVTDFVSVTNFKVNGVRVDALNARFEHGTAANLANGVYVEIKGAQNAQGVFIAREVEFKTGR